MKIQKLYPFTNPKKKTDMENYRPMTYPHQLLKSWKKSFIKDYIASVKLRTYYMKTNMVSDRNTAPLMRK